MTLTKPGQATLYAIASTASNSRSVGSALDVSTYYLGAFRIRMGRGTGTAFTTPPIVRVEGTSQATPDADDWGVLAQFSPAAGASIGSQAVSGTEAAGQTVVTLAAATNFAAGDYVFFHNTTIENSEWCRILSMSGADATLEEALVRAQTGATCRDQAEQYTGLLDLTSISSLRLVVNAYGSGQAVIFQATIEPCTGV